MREESIRKDDYTIYDVGFNFPRFTAWSVFETGIVKMKELISYTFKGTPIRTTVRDSNPWFVAADIAKALEYRTANDAIRYLDDDEADTLNQRTSSSNGVEQARNLTIINESGLYSLILRSRKPEAKAFKKFVTSEVLPSIRKTGAYAVNGEVSVREHTRALPSGKREIVLSEKAKQEIGGIVKSVVAKALADYFALDADAQAHPSGMPFANWALSAVHDIGAMKSEYDALKNRVAQAQNILK